jgi:hypothetical protein
MGDLKTIENVSANKHQSNSDVSWLGNNVARPVYNALVADVYDPLATVVNAVPSLVTGKKLMPHVKPLDVEAPTGVVDRLTQLMAGASVGAFTYAAAGKLAGGSLRHMATELELSRAVAGMLSREATGQILGAAVLDGLKAAPDWRTRAGHVISGTLSMAAFEGTNYLSRGMHLPAKLPLLALTGASVSTAESVASSVLTGKKISLQEVKNAAVDGAAVSVLMPGAQHLLGTAIDAVNVKRGRGIPLERFVRSEYSEGTSAELDSIARKNAFLRVHTDSSRGNRVDWQNNRVFMRDGGTAAELGMQLSFKDIVSRHDGRFKEAAQLLSARNEAARAQFTESRINIESEMRKCGRTIERQLSGDDATARAKQKPEEPSVNKMEKVMADKEFEWFQFSNGKWRPDRTLGRAVKEQLSHLRERGDITGFIKLVKPELSKAEQGALSLAVSDLPDVRKALDIVWSLPATAFRNARTWSLCWDYLSQMRDQPSYVRVTAESGPVLTVLHREMLGPVGSYRDKTSAAYESFSKERIQLREELDDLEDRRSRNGMRFAENEGERIERENDSRKLDETIVEKRNELKQTNERYARVLTQETKALQRAFTQVVDKRIIGENLQFSGHDEASINRRRYSSKYKEYLKASIVFGKNADQWWRIPLQNFQDSGVRDLQLPLSTREELAGLGEFLLKNSDRDPRLLQKLTDKWHHFDAAERQSAKNAKPTDLLPVLAKYQYPYAKNASFATEACRWNVGEHSLMRAEPQFVDSLAVPDAFPTREKWKNNNLSGYFLKRSDPRGLFMGEYVNCCARIDGANEQGALWVQKSPLGGFFFVEDAGTGEVLAASRVWRDPKRGTVTFNNIETRELGPRDQSVLKIYQDAANHLVNSEGVQKVSVGTGHCDLKIDALPDDLEPSQLPPGYEGLNDIDERKILAAAQATAALPDVSEVPQLRPGYRVLVHIDDRKVPVAAQTN